MEWITTADVRNETWRRVLEYAHVDLAQDAIVRRHGPASTSTLRSNYRKQATQIRVAILQAREYFDAAERASLVTSPNHLYYGMVSLASAVMLLCGSGDYSFDVLRKKPGNAHHGLLFSTGAHATNSAKDLVLLDESRVEVLDHGHFRNWSTFVPQHTVSYGTVQRSVGNTKSTAVLPVGLAAGPDWARQIGHKFRLRSLLEHLPDLATSLPRYQLHVPHSRASHDKIFQEGGRVLHRWTLHATDSLTTRDAILSRFEFPSYFHQFLELPDEDDSTGAVFGLSLPANLGLRCRMPSWRSTADFEQFVYAARLGHEFVDVYLLCYGLSMLSRYYPDLWISCLESHCRAAKLIEAATAVSIRKAPLLMLELLEGHPVVITTQRAPWFGSS